jgi:hypothetical protein
MLILVLSVGLAESGVNYIPDLVVSIVYIESEFGTTWSLIVTDMLSVSPADTDLSKAVVKQTRVSDVEFYSIHLVL